jgi:iron complex transport system substrate-binding protein
MRPSSRVWPALLGLLLLGPAQSVPVAGRAAPSCPAAVWVDDLGDTLRLGGAPRRIISLSPSLTEILFAIGVDSARIAGVTRFCDFPPAARRRPQVGGIIDPSLEVIQMKRPDLVLVARGNPMELQRRIRDLGIPLYAFDDRAEVGGILGMLVRCRELICPDDTALAGSLVRRFTRELAGFESWSAALPPRARPRVYYADPEYPTFTCGPGSHVNDLIRLAGGINIVQEGGAWPQFSAERLLAEQPDWLLLALPEGRSRAQATAGLRRLPGWPDLKALKADKVCWIDAGKLQRPGPRTLTALEELAACLHPERPEGGRPDR